MGVSRFGAFLSSMTARPPSTFIWACAMAVEVAATAAPTRNERRPWSGAVELVSFFGTGCLAV